MSQHYYYFIASLPSLSFEDKCPLSSESFLQQCERLLPPRDAVLIGSLWQEDITQDTASAVHPVVYAISEFERAVRNEGVFARAAKWGADPWKYIRGERTSETAVIELVQRALKETDLLKAEQMMDRARWELLESLQGQHYFDLHYALIYGFKLKILERRQKIYSPAGRDIWREMQKIEIPKHLV